MTWAVFSPGIIAIRYEILRVLHHLLSRTPSQYPT